MDSEIFRRATQVFQEVCNLSGDEQERQIESKCEGSEDVRQLVLELLESDRDAESRETAYDRSDSKHDGTTADKPVSRTPAVPGFDILERIGEGGMGVVWRAVQENTRREVALKVFSREALGSNRKRARFEREVELAAMLEHPGIARLYDSGVSAEVPYYAMELIEGDELDDYLRRQKLSDREIVVLFEFLCRAVEHAHICGVIHRDLKPSNVIVRADGQPVVVDFGLAKSFGDEAGNLSVSIDGQIVGTPAYMSPEQAAGESGSLDTRTDVYSLGVLLFRALSGELPHSTSGSTIELLRRIAETEAGSLKKLRPDIDPDLDVLVAKALALERARRYSTAGDLAADLSRWLNGEPIQARPRSTMYVLGKHARRHRLPLALVFLILVGAIVGVSAYVVSLQKSQKEIERWAYAYRVQLASRAYGERNLHECRELLESSPERLRNWESDFLSRQLTSGEDFGPRRRVLCADFSSDGSLVAMGSGKYSSAVEDAGVTILSHPDGQVLRTLLVGNSVETLAFSRNDEEIWVGARDLDLRRYDVATGELLGEEPYPFARRIVASPDGRWMAIATLGEGLSVRDMRDGTSASVLTAEEIGRVSLSFDAASSSLLWSYESWSNGGSFARVFEVGSWRELRVLKRPTSKPRITSSILAFDGRSAVFSAAGTIHLWDFETEETIEVRNGTESMYLTWSPDGTRFFSVSRIALDVWRVVRRPPEREGGPAPYGIDRIWSRLRAGNRHGIAHHPVVPEIHVVGTATQRYDVSRDPAAVFLADHRPGRTGVLAPGIEPAPDSVHCAMYGSEGVEVRTIHDGELIWNSVRPEIRARAISWSKDGERLAAGWGTRVEDRSSESHGVIALHDAQDGQILTERSMDDRVLSLALSLSRGCVVAFSGPIGGLTPGNPPSTISAHSLSDLETIWEEKVEGKIIRGPSVAFSPDGRQLALEAEWTLRVWESESWRRVATFEGERSLSLTAFTFHPTEQRLAAVFQGALVEIDTRTWSIDRSLSRLDDAPPHLSYLPDGSRLAVAGRAGVTLRDTVTGSPLFVVRSGHTEAAVFTPDGRWLLTASNDGKGFRAWPRHDQVAD